MVWYGISSVSILFLLYFNLWFSFLGGLFSSLTSFLFSLMYFFFQIFFFTMDLYYIFLSCYSQIFVPFFFLKFGSLFFLEMAFNDSSQQFLRSSRGKITKKKSWAQIWTKRGKIRPMIRFFAIFLSWVHWFSLKLHTVVACDNV